MLHEQEICLFEKHKLTSCAHFTKKAAQARAVVLPIDFQETSTLNEVKQDDSSEAMVRVYQPPVVNNSRGQTSGQQSINGFQVLFYM